MMHLRSSLAAAMAGLAAVSCTVISQGATPVALPEFRAAAVPIFDDAETAMFKADRAFALAAAGNEEGTALGFERQMVRLSPAGEAGMWVRCSDLQPGLSYCVVPNTDGPVFIPRMLPNCPGDPRCPKRAPKSK